MLCKHACAQTCKLILLVVIPHVHAGREFITFYCVAIVRHRWQNQDSMFLVVNLEVFLCGSKKKTAYSFVIKGILLMPPWKKNTFGWKYYTNPVGGHTYCQVLNYFVLFCIDSSAGRRNPLGAGSAAGHAMWLNCKATLGHVYRQLCSFICYSLHNNSWKPIAIDQ